MISKKTLSKENFKELINYLKAPKSVNIDFLYDVYVLSVEAIEGFEVMSHSPILSIDNQLLVNYLIGEYTYSIQGRNQSEIASFNSNQEIKYNMASVSADKYLTSDLFGYKEKKLTNRFMPTVSSLDLYLNFMLKMLNNYPRNNPSFTLNVDLLIKSVSIARTILELLVRGYETSAMALWRTLHECECTLIALDKGGDKIHSAYLKHMKYGVAFRGGVYDKETTDQTFITLKQEMKDLGLKSKDMKKYIEYGWLLTFDDESLETIKLNFRDGLEKIAGLSEYSKIYEVSSEIIHATPSLIYSNKVYYHFLALISTYESFFRFEKIFSRIFLSHLDKMQQDSYFQMREIYFAQLIAIYDRELENFKKLGH